MSSDPFYNRAPRRAANPTNRSWWFVHILSPNRAQTVAANPTNRSWWFVQILSTNWAQRLAANPTNRSCWFVQILSKGAMTIKTQRLQTELWR